MFRGPFFGHGVDQKVVMRQLDLRATDFFLHLFYNRPLPSRFLSDNA